MKIVDVDILEADGGLRTLSFLKIVSDEGLVGWSEFSESLGARGLGNIIRQAAEPLKGRDPRQVARLSAELQAGARLTRGGLHRQAIAAIENACLDLKARALGIPVSELLGGSLRDRVRVYWSHCGMYRVNPRTAHLVGVPPVRTLDDLERLGREVVARGFHACKTNPVRFGEDGVTPFNPGFRVPGLEFGRVLDRRDVDAIYEHVVALRRGVGAHVGLAVDVNFGFTLEGLRRLGRALEPLDLMWLEMDVPEPVGLARVRDSIRTPVASLETIYGIDGYRPFLEARAVDVAIVDVMWNGLLEAVKIATLAESFEVNVAAHAYTGALAGTMAAHYAAVVPNMQIVEMEVDDAPWRNDFVTVPPVVQDGALVVPSGPGWGTEVNEEAVRAHVPR